MALTLGAYSPVISRANIGAMMIIRYFHPGLRHFPNVKATPGGENYHEQETKAGLSSLRRRRQIALYYDSGDILPLAALPSPRRQHTPRAR